MTDTIALEGFRDNTQGKCASFDREIRGAEAVERGTRSGFRPRFVNIWRRWRTKCCSVTRHSIMAGRRAYTSLRCATRVDGTNSLDEAERTIEEAVETSASG